jgi:hypothetical protein
MGNVAARCAYIGQISALERWSMKIDWAQVSTAVGSVAGGVAAIYGALKGYTDGRNVISDWLAIRPHGASGFTVRATISKTVIHTDRTEFIRLRTVRAHQRVNSLKIDHVPIIVAQDGKEQKAKMSNYYAMPGRATLSDDEMFHIGLLDDEALRAHADHSVVLGYIMEETRDVLFTPPGVALVPPVGSDYAVIEVHFPGCHLSLDIAGKPAIRLYSKDINTKAETDIAWGPSKQANVAFPEHDPDWIRARINEPPQDSEIWLDWQWQGP